MGAIQNSMIKGAAGIAGAIGGIGGAIKAEDAKQEAFNAEGEGLLKEQATLAGEAEVNTRKVEDATNTFNAAEKKAGDKRVKRDDTKARLAHDLEVAKQSLTDLQTQQDAIRKLRGINTAKIEAYRLRGGKI